MTTELYERGSPGISSRTGRWSNQRLAGDEGSRTATWNSVSGRKREAVKLKSNVHGSPAWSRRQ